MIISNSSPLINLSGVGQLEILRRLYNTIRIPKAVWDEVVIHGEGEPGSLEVRGAKWVKVIDVKNIDLVVVLKQSLHSGESEAIALAREQKTELLLIDDLQARKSARLFGLNCIGTLGILREAKEKKLIAKVKPIIENLRDELGFWIDNQFLKEYLHSIDE